MKKLLIISYFFPPCMKSGSQRAIKMAQHLPESGIEPVILTAENALCDRNDPESVKAFQNIKVYRTPEDYPFRNKKHLAAKVTHRIWRKRMPVDVHWGWVKHAQKAALKIIREEGINGIFVTAFPFSAFEIGFWLHEQTGLPWFMDYRDPWISNPAFTQHHTPEKLKTFEEKYLNSCSLFFGATPGITDITGQPYGQDIRDKGRVFTYAYDPAEYPEPGALNKKITLLSTGAVYDAKTGDNLIGALEMMVENKKIDPDTTRFISYGNLKTQQKIPPAVAAMIEIHPYIQREQLLQHMASAHGFILPHGSGPTVALCYPGRLFEYFALQKPILYIGPDGVAANAVRESGIGVSVGDSDRGEISTAFQAFLYGFVLNETLPAPNTTFIESFHVKQVMRKFVNDIEPVLT